MAGYIRALLDGVPSTQPGLAGVTQIPDFNDLARRIEMAKMDRERALGRERQAIAASQQAAAVTEEMEERLRLLKAQWQDLQADLLTFEE